MTALPVHRYQFNCRMLDPLKLNVYAGSMLRGAFGRALRKSVCVTRMTDCKGCLLYRQCAYPRIFETPPPPYAAFQKFSQIPNAFIIEPPPMGRRELAAGDPFSFNLVLIGRAVADLPIVIHAWTMALKAGLGSSHAKAELVDVAFEPEQTAAQVIYSTANENRLLPLPVFKPQPISATEKIGLRLLTPLRIQQQGKVLSDTMRGRDFIMALMRRYYLLQEFHTQNYQPPDFKALGAQAERIQAHHQFQWCEWDRYSHRQQQSMTFGGVLGSIELSGDLTPFLPFLQAGQWLHVGSKTTFGMGRYVIMTQS
jgi:hypothetical protein